jgi:predicted NBD/HSP70 family sugar kinase
LCSATTALFLAQPNETLAQVRGFNEIVYLFGGAGGIGGGVVVGGQILRGASGFAGELGHIRISDSKLEDNAGLPGTLEALLRREELLDATSPRRCRRRRTRSRRRKNQNP